MPATATTETSRQVRDHQMSFLAPLITSIDCGMFIELLSDGQWRRSSWLLRQMGLPFTDNNRRKLRIIAEESNGLIGGGQDGYKLIELMTPDEFSHWHNWMRSQTRKMLRRTIQAAKVYYRKYPRTV